MLSRRSVVLAGVGIVVVVAAVYSVLRSTIIVDTEEDLWPDPRARQAVHMGVLNHRIQNFYRDHEALPSTPQVIADSVTRTDLWGTPVQYVARDSIFTIRSAGPDRTLGTTDDTVEETGTTYHSKRLLYDRARDST
jgi:hypothetical protein